MASREEHIRYIRENLIAELVRNHFQQDLVDADIINSESLDGFMSALYTVRLRLCDDKHKREHVQQLIIKFMKGDKFFRESSKSYTQFANEIFIYSKVLPYYEQIVVNSGSSIKVREWVPHVYLAKYGIIDGLGNGLSPESVLALEDLRQKGYRCGPPLYLDREHLILMTKPLAEYHAFTYAMRIQKDPQLKKFIDEIKPLPFIDVSTGGVNFYDILYQLAFERFFMHFDKMKESYEDKKYVENVNNLRYKYGKTPTELLEKFREADDIFPVILHGDYNRNNVLFQYDKEGTFDDPRDAKMIDFQELRYGSPAIDLSFFMYMNMDPHIRKEFWMELLSFYHKTLIKSLTEILVVDADHESLRPYSFERFYEHFSNYAFYGCMVCLHFLPWKTCSEEECQKLSYFFETNMQGDDFRKISLEAGGEKSDELIADIARHASQMGYMKNL